MQNGQPWNEADPDAPGHDLPGIVDFLHQCDCDLILLQEVEEGHDGGQQIQPPPNFTALQRALPDHHAQFAYPPINPDELPFGLGLGIFSRFPLSEPKTHLLPAADLTFPFAERERRPSERILLEATAQLPSGTLRVLNAHLQAYFMLGTSSEIHRAQRDAVEEILRHSPVPTILGGDFNCAPEENLVDQFSAAGFPPVQTTEITWRRRPYILDHLFHSRNLRVLSHSVIPTLASDHHAVRAELEFIKP